MFPYPKPKSHAQRSVLHAAAAGKSNLGIPRKIGAEFVKGDKPGKPPAQRETQMIAAFPNQNFSPPSELGRNVPKRSYPSFYLHVMPSCRITRTIVTSFHVSPPVAS